MKIIKDRKLSEDVYNENINADGHGDQISSREYSTRNRKKY